MRKGLRPPHCSSLQTSTANNLAGIEPNENPVISQLFTGIENPDIMPLTMDIQALINQFRQTDASQANLLRAQLNIARKSKNKALVSLTEKVTQKTILSQKAKRVIDCLVADDDRHILDSIEMMFRLQGFSVVTASSISEMHQLLQENLFISIFSDINMPTRDRPVESQTTSWDALYDFRKDNTVSEIYIISAHAQERHNVLGHPELDVKAHIQKPFTASTLIPYLKHDKENFDRLEARLSEHPSFNLELWKTKCVTEYCNDRFNQVGRNYTLAAKLCNVSERTIRRALKQHAELESLR